ncbi:MAG TPA: sulfotransferase family protein [Gammaproteobacteria bacterium]|nr:sulfotransferase family protein [Gammaproteobacteria bacterium]
MENSQFHANQARLNRVREECQQILRKNPNSVDALARLGDASLRLNDFSRAIAAFQRLAAIDPRCINAHLGLARAFLLTGSPAQALEQCEKALQIDAGNLDALGLAAMIEERNGHGESAYKRLKKVVNNGNRTPPIALPFAAALASLGKHEEAVDLLQEALVLNKGIPNDYLTSMYFQLGRLYDKLKKYDSAFESFRQANNLKYQQFDLSRPIADTDMLIALFTKQFVKEMPRSGCESEEPIFIIGMPRSGTTLIEQIIASHPQGEGAGELAAIPQLEASLCASFGRAGHYTNCISLLTRKHLDEFAEKYLSVLHHNRTGSLRITDKMPVNFMSVGFIEMLFPRARVIICDRNAADICLSCYFQDFLGVQAFMNKLSDIGILYKCYKRITSHWRTVSGLRILNVRYEDLVSEPYKNIRKIIEFTGLNWDEGCTKYYERRNFVNTVSYEQVRKPVYKTSISRWKNYEKHLTELEQSLGNLWPDG